MCKGLCWASLLDNWNIGWKPTYEQIWWPTTDLGRFHGQNRPYIQIGVCVYFRESNLPKNAIKYCKMGPYYSSTCRVYSPTAIALGSSAIVKLSGQIETEPTLEDNQIWCLKCTLRIIGPFYRGVWTCIARVRILKIATFEWSGFLG